MVLGMMLVGYAQAGGAERLSLSAGFAGVGGAPDSVGGLGVAYLSARLTPVFSVDVGGGMGLVAGPLREITAIHVAARARVGQHLFGRAGLVHQHETPWEDYLAEPITHTIGAGQGIGHRSGLDAGLGLQWDLPELGSVGTHVSVAAIGSWFPDPNGPALYGKVETLFTIDLGRASPDTSEG